jgi:hypothetical protein
MHCALCSVHVWRYWAAGEGGVHKEGGPGGVGVGGGGGERAHKNCRTQLRASWTHTKQAANPRADDPYCSLRRKIGGNR